MVQSDNGTDNGVLVQSADLGSVNEDLSLYHKMLGEKFTAQISELQQTFSQVIAEDAVFA